MSPGRHHRHHRAAGRGLVEPHRARSPAPIPAGPAIPAPGAQCPEGITARHDPPHGAPDRGPGRDAGGVGWPPPRPPTNWGCAGCPPVPPRWSPRGRPCCEVAPDCLVLSAVKPAEDGDGFVLRLLNPSGTAVAATVTLGVPVAEVDVRPPGRVGRRGLGRPARDRPSRFERRCARPPHRPGALTPAVPTAAPVFTGELGGGHPGTRNARIVPVPYVAVARRSGEGYVLTVESIPGVDRAGRRHRGGRTRDPGIAQHPAAGGRPPASR